MFLKTPNTVAGPFDTVSIPRGSTKTDWEVELGIVVGPLPEQVSERRTAESEAGQLERLALRVRHEGETRHHMFRVSR